MGEKGLVLFCDFYDILKYYCVVVIITCVDDFILN
jgi:hypothetical protein